MSRNRAADLRFDTLFASTLEGEMKIECQHNFFFCPNNSNNTNNSITINNNNNNNSNNYVHELIENMIVAYNSSPSNPSSAASFAFCAVCEEVIFDKTLICIGGRYWHEKCLKCVACNKLLQNEPNCFQRDMKMYCRDDFFLAFAACGKCKRVVGETDWVRKAEHLVYHLACFSCDTCSRQLSDGEQFGLLDDKILCEGHLLHVVEGTPESGCTKNVSDPGKGTKTKRGRTSFKQAQLTALKSSFERDSTPDGPKLEVLAALTGLPKRVTQVWFQNTRARQKKGIEVINTINDQTPPLQHHPGEQQMYGGDVNVGFQDMCLTYQNPGSTGSTPNSSPNGSPVGSPMDPNTPMMPMNPNTPMMPMNPNTPMMPVEPTTHMMPMVPNTPMMPMVPNTPMMPMQPTTYQMPMQPTTYQMPMQPTTHQMPMQPTTHQMPMDPNTHLMHMDPNMHLMPMDPNTHLMHMEPTTHMMHMELTTHMMPMDPNTYLMPMEPTTHMMPMDPNTYLMLMDPNTYLMPMDPMTSMMPMEPTIQYQQNQYGYQ